MYAALSELENRFPSIAEFRAGDSMLTSTFHQLKMTDDVSSFEGFVKKIYYLVHWAIHSHTLSFEEPYNSIKN